MQLDEQKYRKKLIIVGSVSHFYFTIKSEENENHHMEVQVMIFFNHHLFLKSELFLPPGNCHKSIK